MEILWSKEGYLEYWGMTIFLFIILIYPVKGKIFIGSKQWTWEEFQQNNGVSEKFNPIKYRGIYFTGKDSLI